MNLKQPYSFLRTIRWHIAFLCGVFLFFSGVSFAAGDMVAITNDKNPITSLTIVDLRKMYKCKKTQWGNGEPIKLFLPPSKSKEMETVFQKVFRFKSEVQIAKYYVKAIFQQKLVRLPEATTGTTDTILKIAQNPGGLAIIDLSKADAREGIKLIRIIPIEGL